MKSYASKLTIFWVFEDTLGRQLRNPNHSRVGQQSSKAGVGRKKLEIFL
jgi:hypothetical protein